MDRTNYELIYELIQPNLFSGTLDLGCGSTQAVPPPSSLPQFNVFDRIIPSKVPFLIYKYQINPLIFNF